MNLNDQKMVELDRRQTAFTLVELLGVVAIMLIILRLTLPSLDGILGGDGDGMARTQVVGDLNRARQMALERATPVYVVFMPLYDDIWPNSQESQVEVGSTFFDQDAKRAYFLSDEGVNALLGSQLASYAIYAEYMPGDQPGSPSTKWLTDWKKLPAGYHFNRAELNGLFRVPVTYLKGSKPETSTAGLSLPCIKFNSRGELESFMGERELGGMFVSVSKGGVLPPGKNQFDTYLPVNGDPPEAIAPNDRKWLYVNGVTGRAEIRELTDEEAAAGLDLQKNQYQLFIKSSPEYPPSFHVRMNNCLPIINWFKQTEAQYNENWKGPPEWSVAPDGRSFPSNPWPDTSTLQPAFSKLPNRQAAVRLKWLMEDLVEQSFSGGKIVEIEIRRQE